MRLRLLIGLIIFYILVAFAWLTYSLLDYANRDYKLKNDVLKTGLNACILQVIEKAKNKELGADPSTAYYLKELRLDVNPDKLRSFVESSFRGNYAVTIQHVNNSSLIQIQLNPERVQELIRERDRQKKIWIFQSALLFLLVSAGVFGVYNSIRSVTSLNKRQNNFLLSVTHEFKTPIAAIRLMLQTAKNPKVNEEMKADLIEKSIQNTHRLEELTENMLTATQIESDRYQMVLSSFDLAELLEKIISNYRIKGEIHDDLQEGIQIEADEFTMRIVFSNLIENAFKYSDNNPVEVRLFKEKGDAVIQVKDQGIGIPKNEYRKIFKKFYRIQDEETRTTKGTGLGLFIVKQVVEKHHGSIWAEANEPKGSVFTVRLPMTDI